MISYHGFGLSCYDQTEKIKNTIHRKICLLTNTNMNINDISCKVGFSCQRHFSTSFKQVKGMTPTQFKEESKRN
ncbi:helix-turn-helix domain-containing protein [Phocaeicola vulgatus]|nr:helix-turn-helix domain-containing protein [Phocaeicola vulgatus]